MNEYERLKQKLEEKANELAALSTTAVSYSNVSIDVDKIKSEKYETYTDVGKAMKLMAEILKVR